MTHSIHRQKGNRI